MYSNGVGGDRLLEAGISTRIGTALKHAGIYTRSSVYAARIQDFSTDHNITIKPPPRLCISIIFLAAVAHGLRVAASLISHAAKHCINSQ